MAETTGAWEKLNPEVDLISYDAGADVSALKGTCAAMDSAGRAVTTTNGQNFIGIFRLCEDADAAGKTCQVQGGGYAIAKAVGALATLGELMVPSTGGALKIITADTDIVVGKNMTKCGSAGDFFTLKIAPTEYCTDFSSVT